MTEWDYGITGYRDAACGFLDGILVSGGFLAWVFPGQVPLPAGPLLVLFGSLLLLDDAYPFGRQPQVASMLGGVFAGLVTAVLSFFAPAAFIWPLLIAFLISSFKAADKLFRRYHGQRAKIYKP